MTTNKFFKACVLATILMGMAASCYAEKKVDIFDLTFEENFVTPEIKKDLESKKIQEYQNNQAIDLIQHGYEVELTRNKEVVIINIPADKLFESNDTTLLNGGKSYLKPLLKYTTDPGFYKILLVMHSDNTGSKDYCTAFTTARVCSVLDWMETCASTNYVVAYAKGLKDPLYSNDSMQNRQHNRRLEIYLVPGDVMIEQAKKGSIRQNVNKK